MVDGGVVDGGADGVCIAYRVWRMAKYVLAGVVV
jgi:hypothetical protein